MTAVTGSVHCPHCGEAVPIQAEMRSVQVDGDQLWVQLYDPKPKHKCPRRSHKEN